MTHLIPGRGIPAGGVAPPSHMVYMLGRRALPSGRRAPGLRQAITFPGDSQFKFYYFAGAIVSNKTMSESASPTAAMIERPSGDQDTRRAMNVGRSPKSVI
jgi:hypothetical protein